MLAFVRTYAVRVVQVVRVCVQINDLGHATCFATLAEFFVFMSLLHKADTARRMFRSHTLQLTSQVALMMLCAWTLAWVAESARGDRS